MIILIAFELFHLTLLIVFIFISVILIFNSLVLITNTFLHTTKNYSKYNHSQKNTLDNNSTCSNH